MPQIWETLVQGRCQRTKQRHERSCSGADGEDLSLYSTAQERACRSSTARGLGAQLADLTTPGLSVVMARASLADVKQVRAISEGRQEMTAADDGAADFGGKK